MPLTFFFLANKHQTSCEDVFRDAVTEAANLGVNAYFNKAIHNTGTTMRPGSEINNTNIIY